MRLLVAAVVLVLAGPAGADNKDAARAAYQEATREYDLNEFDKALEAFKRAYRNYEEPAFLFNIAQCERQLGKKDEAIKFYRSYLRKMPDAPNRAEVERLIAGLEASIDHDRTTTKPPPPPEAPVLTPKPTAPAVVSAPLVPPPSTPTVVKSKPAYKKWWLWTVVGVVAAGAAAGIAVGVTQSARSEPALTPVTIQ
jgi:tetratricopeptide (TPR) repeat protein